ncbi:MAG: type II toxin-antitoxin system MqsA family antitoxin [Phycisphaeraceae bacterium]
MRCPICKHGETALGEVTVTLERNGAAVVFRHVPAQVCQTCGGRYVDEATSARLLAQANAAIRAGVQVEVRAYAAA